MLWVMMFVGKNWVSLLHCLDVPIIIKSVLCILSQVYYLSSSQSKSPSCVRERFVCVVYKYMYSWVLYAYKWWYNLWFWIRELSGWHTEKNSSGPSTEPWGTQPNKGTTFEKQFMIFIDWNPLFKNELIHVSAVPDMSYQLDRCLKMQIYLMVLVLWYFLCACLVICRCELSEWNCLCADWKTLNKRSQVYWTFNRLPTTFYNTLDMNDILEIGIYLFKWLAGKDGFLRSGFWWACLKWEGITSELSYQFIILVITEIRVWRQDFSRYLRIGSHSQDLFGDDKISLAISVSEADLNTVQLENQYHNRYSTSVGCCSNGFGEEYGRSQNDMTEKYVFWN